MALTSGLKVARLFGLTVRVHWSWILIFALLTWGLASNILPLSDVAGGGPWWRGMERLAAYAKANDVSGTQALRDLRSWPTWEYWVLGVIGSIGLFLCVLAHELSHSLTAKASGMQVEGITLFIFGGVSNLREEAPDAWTELKVAAAGPAMSVLLAVVFWIVYFAGGVGLGAPIRSLVFYFAFVNSLLVAFNLVPGFPLDGGRIFRAALWAGIKDFYKATNIAASVGRGIGSLMIVGGILFGFFTFDFGWLWIALIGWFLHSAAHASQQQTAIRHALEGLTVDKVVQPEVVTVPPDLTVEQLVDQYFYRYRYRSFPVQDDGRLLGMVGINDVQGVPRTDWGERTVRQTMHQISEENLVHPTDDLAKVFRKMMAEDKGHLPVVEDGALKGIVTRHDIMTLLQIRSDLAHPA